MIVKEAWTKTWTKHCDGETVTDKETDTTRTRRMRRTCPRERSHFERHRYGDIKTDKDADTNPDTKTDTKLRTRIAIQ